MVHTKYQGYRPFVPDKKIFMFSLICLCNTCDPCIGPFWPKGHNLNRLGRGLLGDATQNIKALCMYKPMLNM